MFKNLSTALLMCLAMLCLLCAGAEAQCPGGACSQARVYQVSAQPSRWVYAAAFPAIPATCDVASEGCTNQACSSTNCAACANGSCSYGQSCGSSLSYASSSGDGARSGPIRRILGRIFRRN